VPNGKTVPTVVYYINGIREHTQCVRKCAGTCACTLKYDGLEDDVVMVNSRFGVSVNLLDSFFIAMYTLGVTAMGFATLLQVQYETRMPQHFLEHPDHVLTRGRLNAAVIAYRSIVDYAKVEKCCTTCGETPKTVVCDGSALGVLSAQLVKLLPDDRLLVTSVVAVGRSFEASFFVPPASMGKELQALLVRFVRVPPESACPLGTCVPDITKASAALTDAEVAKMLTLVKASKCPRLTSLHKLLDEAVQHPARIDNTHFVCDPAYAHLLFPLIVHSTAFAAYKPLDVAKVLDLLHDATTPAEHAAVLPRVNELLPWISFFLRDVGVDMLPDYAKPAIKAVADYARGLASWEQTYRLVKDSAKDGAAAVAKTLEQLRGGTDAERAAAAEIESALEFVDRSSPECVEEDLKMGRYFGPGLRWQRRGRFVYEIDGVNGPNEKIYGKRECTKESPTTHSHSPGVFCVLCPHGVVYALTLMRSAESPAHLFDLLYSRFKKLPDLILYDNGCNEMQFCVRREPGLLVTQTRFAIDRLHYKNHVNCSTFFRLHELSVVNADIGRTDSQRAEQFNKLLQRIKSIIHFSTGYNAISALRGFAVTAHFFRERASAQRARSAARPVARAAAPPDEPPSLEGALDDDDTEQQHEEIGAAMDSDDD
jgi:hypothetical protein